jgi:hypothetical protein
MMIEANNERGKHMDLATYLKQQSAKICQMNECTEDEHKCESYAYIDKERNLLDICYSDFFAGSSEPYAAIPLPWDGTQEELEDEIASQTWEE